MFLGKATATNADPIKDAVEGAGKDQLGRYARSLAWMREQHIRREPDAAKIKLLDRFIKSHLHPSYQRRHIAAAVIDAAMVAAELAKHPVLPPADPSLEIVIVAIPDLKGMYEAVYAAALEAAAP